LTAVNRTAYASDVAETTANGFGDPIMMADDRRSAVFLRPYAFARLFNGWAWAGRPSGLPVPSCRFANPAQRPPTPFGDGTRAFLNHDGGRTMLRQASARPEQLLPKNLTSLVNAALHAAAVAPSLADALDVAGSALCDIADLARREPSVVVEEGADTRFYAARDTVDDTMNTLDRLSSLCEAIARCSLDKDQAIEDLALVACEIARAEAHRLDCVFTRLAHQPLAAEVRHGQ
jgi:hypothetical protein